MARWRSGNAAVCRTAIQRFESAPRLTELERPKGAIMASPELQPTTKERVGTVVKYSGIVGGLVGLLSLNPVLAIVGAGAWLGGKWIENTGKKQP